MTAERTINALKSELKKVNNMKFTNGDTDYRIEYEGGLAEYIGIYGRKKGGIAFRFVDGFPAYDLGTKERVIDKAKQIIFSKK